MTRYRRTLTILLGLISAAGIGAWLYVRTRPVVPAEQGFEDVSPEDMERWMQDIGYTE